MSRLPTPREIRRTSRRSRSRRVGPDLGVGIRDRVRRSVSHSRQPRTLSSGESQGVIIATLRDLQWRARRFVIAGVGAAMVFALTLVLAGLESSFAVESRHTVDAIGGDTYVVERGVQSVFGSLSVVPPTAVREIKGVQRADPIALSHHSVQVGGKLLDVELLGYQPGGFGTPPLWRGRLPQRADEIVVDRSLHAGIGKQFLLAGRRVLVVGQTKRLTINGGQPMMYMRLSDSQKLLPTPVPYVSAVVTKGVPTHLPEGLVLRSKDQTRKDLLRPLVGAIASLKAMLVLLWLVALMVIGSVVYLSALERRRDFAVYKATGWSTRTLAIGLAMQAVLLSTVAALVGVVVAQLLLPLFPMEFEVPALARALLPVIGVVVGLLSSVVGLRKAVGVEPALAFGGP
jgi:putative ABC transport system permease protein